MRNHWKFRQPHKFISKASQHNWVKFECHKLNHKKRIRKGKGYPSCIQSKEERAILNQNSTHQEIKLETQWKTEENKTEWTNLVNGAGKKIEKQNRKKSGSNYEWVDFITAPSFKCEIEFDIQLLFSLQYWILRGWVGVWNCRVKQKNSAQIQLLLLYLYFISLGRRIHMQLNEYIT